VHAHIWIANLHEQLGGWTMRHPIQQIVDVGTRLEHKAGERIPRTSNAITLAHDTSCFLFAATPSSMSSTALSTCSVIAFSNIFMLLPGMYKKARRGLTRSALPS